ncbi:MAG: response regulator transcription factor [Flavobacteriales bacterium]
MIGMLLRPLVLLSGALFLLPPIAVQAAEELDPHTNVCMRTIGHAVLLKAGDPLSRVLPVEREADSYRIAFAAEFGFVPEVLAATVDSVMAVTKLSKNYVVEVEQCDSGKVVYSYERGAADTLDILPCLSRALPSACYTLRITLLDAAGPEKQLAGVTVNVPKPFQGPKGWIMAVGLGLLITLIAYAMFRRKPRPVNTDSSSGVAIGAFHFDKGKLELSIQDRKLELTGKEADLLHLLHASANETVAREVMLKEVWGNESDYVGRTLDVFISKLRKKLEADPNVRIANIRGVGYRLILDN